MTTGYHPKRRNMILLLEEGNMTFTLDVSTKLHQFLSMTVLLQKLIKLQKSTSYTSSESPTTHTMHNFHAIEQCCINAMHERLRDGSTMV